MEAKAALKLMNSRFAIIIHSYNPTGPGRRVRPALFDPGWWRRAAPLALSTPAVVSSPFGRTEGRLVVLNRTIAQLRRLPAGKLIKRTIQAGKKATRWGACMIGFGYPFSKVLGDSALSVARALAPTVTSGAGCAAAAAVDGIGKAAGLMGINLEEAAAVVVGATEPLGYLCTYILARDGVNYLTLIGGDHGRLEHLARRVLYDCGVACKTSANVDRAIARADLIIVAGGRGGAPVFHPPGIKSGAIVCNLSAADELTLHILNERQDVMTFDQVVLRMPGASALNYDFGLPGADIYAPMAEVILLALEGRPDRYFLGPELRVEKVLAMRSLIRKHGFTISGFSALDRHLDFAGVRAIGKAAT